MEELEELKSLDGQVSDLTVAMKKYVEVLLQNPEMAKYASDIRRGYSVFMGSLLKIREDINKDKAEFYEHRDVTINDVMRGLTNESGAHLWHPEYGEVYYYLTDPKKTEDGKVEVHIVGTGRAVIVNKNDLKMLGDLKNMEKEEARHM